MTSTSPETTGSAVLYDGASAARHRVIVTIRADRLSLAPSDERAAGPDCPLSWPWSGVHTLDPRSDGHVFSTDRAPDARLIVADAAIATAIQAWATGDSPAGHGPGFWTRHRRAVIAIGATAMAFLLITLLIKPITEGVAALLPEDAGAAVADQAIQTLAEEHRICTGDDGLIALRSLTNRLAGAAGLAPPVLTVLDLGMANAGALPGRRIVVMRGLIDDAESAAEISAVLAHELAHVVHRDPLAGWIRGDVINLLTSAIFGASAVGDAGQAVTALLLDASYTREQEARADATAIDMLRRTGLTADGGARFFQRLAKQEAVPATLRPVVRLLTTHPGSAERADRFAAAATGVESGLTEAEWAAVRAVCG
ncbi:MAG: M48 family metallopeptidase [Alphaproteobacteria bacterium]|nr:M48 family metallopeptidase [Alphaproteobacteria bacterium]